MDSLIWFQEYSSTDARENVGQASRLSAAVQPRQATLCKNFPVRIAALCAPLTGETPVLRFAAWRVSFVSGVANGAGADQCFALFKTSLEWGAMKITFLNPRTTLVALVSSLICVAAASGSDAKSDIALKLVAEDFTQPIALVPLPDSSGRVVIVDQIGTVLLVAKDGPAKLFFDIRDRLVKLEQGFDERGLLGM